MMACRLGTLGRGVWCSLVLWMVVSSKCSESTRASEGRVISCPRLTSEKFLITPKEIEELAASVAKEAVLLQKVRAPN